MLELNHSGPFVEAAIEMVGDVQEGTRSGSYILCPQGLYGLMPWADITEVP